MSIISSNFEKGILSLKETRFEKEEHVAEDEQVNTYFKIRSVKFNNTYVDFIHSFFNTSKVEVEYSKFINCNANFSRSIYNNCITEFKGNTFDGSVTFKSITILGGRFVLRDITINNNLSFESATATDSVFVAIKLKVYGKEVNFKYLVFNNS